MATSNTSAEKGPSPSKGPLKPVYLILGTDQPKKEKAVRRLKLRVAQAGDGAVGDLNVDAFGAESGNAPDVVNAANTMAFLGGLRLILVYGVDRWAAEDKAVVVDYLKDPAPDAVVCMVGASLPTGDALRETVRRVGDVLKYDVPKGAKFAEWVRRQAGLRGLELDKTTADYLVERVGEHQHLVLRELEKLAVYAGRGPITEADIREVCADSPEGSVFTLVDALAGGAGATVFRELGRLYAMGEKPSGILYRVLRHFERIVRLLALRGAGVTLKEAQERLSLHPYVARKLWPQAEAIGQVRARSIIGLLAETDARLKGMSPLSSLPAGVGDRMELELCLGRILAIGTDSEEPVWPVPVTSKSEDKSRRPRAPR